MTLLTIQNSSDLKGSTVLLLHEALARSRQTEAEQAAREHRLARSVTAGRTWSRLARLARFAQRRAERSRTAAR